MKTMDNNICRSNNPLLEREWLEFNKLGAYSNSTICGMNNKRYHGLLVVPCNGLEKWANVLAKFEESVFIENRLYEISTNCYEGSIYPDGYKYLKKFNFLPFPKFYYYIEDRKIEKTIFLQQDKNILIIRSIPTQASAPAWFPSLAHSANPGLSINVLRQHARARGW